MSSHGWSHMILTQTENGGYLHDTTYDEAASEVYLNRVRLSTDDRLHNMDGNADVRYTCVCDLCHV